MGQREGEVAEQEVNQGWNSLGGQRRGPESAKAVGDGCIRWQTRTGCGGNSGCTTVSGAGGGCVSSTGQGAGEGEGETKPVLVLWGRGRCLTRAQNGQIAPSLRVLCCCWCFLLCGPAASAWDE